jgi:adenylylsulfate kinase
MPGGRVIWITGLSGAGKTTLAQALLPFLPQPRLLLDGDAMREALALLGGGYGRADRIKLTLTYARLCLLAASQGQQVVCATISLFHEVHEWNRANLPRYFEVFLDMPQNVLATRDYKKVYARPDGHAPVMGETLAPEWPLNPDLRLSDSNMTPGDAAAEILNALR